MSPDRQVQPLKAVAQGAVDQLGRRLPRTGCYLIACRPNAKGERVRGFAAFQPTPSLIDVRDVIRRASLQLPLPEHGYRSPADREPVELYFVPTKFHSRLLAGETGVDLFDGLVAGPKVGVGYATKGGEKQPVVCPLTLAGIAEVEECRAESRHVIFGFRLLSDLPSEFERRVFLLSGGSQTVAVTYCLTVFKL